MAACPRCLPAADDCRVCGIDHDPVTHETTLGLRAWLGAELERKLAGPAVVAGVALRVPARKSERPGPAAPRQAPRRRSATPRVRPPATGRGQAWNRNEAVTIAAVVAGYRRGLLTPALAKELGCRPQTIHDRMMEWRRTSAEFRAIDATLTACPHCTRKKARHSEQCSVCTRKDRRVAARSGGQA